MKSLLLSAAVLVLLSACNKAPTPPAAPPAAQPAVPSVDPGKVAAPMTDEEKKKAMEALQDAAKKASRKGE